MTPKSPRKKRSGSGGRTRFGLSRKGELVMAGVGVLVLVAAGALFWTILSPHLGTDAPPPERIRLANERCQKRWTSLVESGAVLKIDAARETVFLDTGAWEDLLPLQQEEAAAGAVLRHGWTRCYVYDGATGRQLGWYTERDGYRRTPDPKP